MPGRIRAKWRPSLALILACTLATVLCLPVLGIVGLEILTPMLGARRALLFVALAVLAATAITGGVLWRILLRPITALSRRATEARRGAAGALDPLGHYGTREMQQLGQAVLDMGRVLQGREAVLRSYADHATHELKGPLTVLRGAAELLDAEDVTPDERRALLARIDEAADRMTALLEAQRMLARAREPLAAGRARVGPLLRGLRLDHPGVAVSVGADEILPLGEDGLRLVLDHLIGNAEAVGAQSVRIEATGTTLTVADDGPGVSAGNRRRIFDPFFTTRRAEGGTGMGLPIVRRMLEAHGAEIALVSTGAGAVFEITF